MSCPPFVRVLVVEDFEPFRRFTHTTLQESELQIIGEVSDGLEAVSMPPNCSLT
jgi:CheY-like chemotaxis protein